MSQSIKKIGKFDDTTSSFSHSHFHPRAYGVLPGKRESFEQTEEPVMTEVPAQ